MLINTKYVGFFPLGSDIVLDGVLIMQCPWAACTKTVLAIGGGGPVCPLGGMVFSATQGNSVAFFVAIEEGLGKYHIFSINKKASEKLKKKALCAMRQERIDDQSHRTLDFRLRKSCWRRKGSEPEMPRRDLYTHRNGRVSGSSPLFFHQRRSRPILSEGI